MLVREAAGDGDGAAAQIGDGVDGTVVADDERAAIAMTQVDDLDGNPLRPERDGHGSNKEGRLHTVGDESFLDFREALKHARKEDLAVV